MKIKQLILCITEILCEFNEILEWVIINLNSKRTTSYERLRKMGFSAVISIIILIYNRQELVRETLDSNYEQTYQGWECIVVDDGSTDNTWDTLLGI